MDNKQLELELHRKNLLHSKFALIGAGIGLGLSFLLTDYKKNFVSSMFFVTLGYSFGNITADLVTYNKIKTLIESKDDSQL